MPEEKRSSYQKHTVSLEQRERLKITGVIDVVSFDEESIVAETDMGMLIIRGRNLHVNKLSLENGELNIDGEIDSLTYEEEVTYSKGKGIAFLGKLFK